MGPWAGWLVPAYTTMLVLGVLLGSVLTVDQAVRAQYTKRDTLLVLMAAYLGGLLGASMVPLGQGLWALAETGRFALRSGLAAYGGMIGGTFVAAMALRAKGLRVLPMLDAAAPGLALGYFVTRMGCLLAGCDYGQTTTLPFALEFPPGSHAFRDHLSRGWIGADSASSLPVHPTQVYMSLSGLALYLLLRTRPPSATGRRFGYFILGYGTLRFVIEFFRGDAARGSLGPLSTSQWIALVSIATLGVFVALYPRFRISSSP